MATATMRLGLADHGRAMTLDDYLDAETDHAYRYELARGVLEVTNVPDDPHGEIVCFLYCALAEYRLAHPKIIHRFGGAGEFQLILPEMISGRNPDVAVVLGGTPKDRRGRRPASLAIEVVSEGEAARERDYVTKRHEYLAYGLREYWIVDPSLRRVTILARDGDAWVESIVGDGQQAASVVLPGFVIEPAALWAAAESQDTQAE
jgi:Uma2 family endonuclease